MKRSTLAVSFAAMLGMCLAPALLAQQKAASPAALDFEYFKSNIQPIFLAKRPGHARCIACHGDGTTMQLVPVSEGRATWTDEQARKNFDIIRLRVVPNDPGRSKLLLHPLAHDAGGDLYHNGGKHWKSQDDPEWQTLAAWVKGQKGSAPARTARVRIIQTNSAGDNVHVIDPATNKVVGVIDGIEVGHGAAGSPDGSRLYVSNEADSTLDVVDARTLNVTTKIPLSGHPNNIAIGKDGRRVYVSIREGAGAVDVIDTVGLQRAKSIPTKGGVHNTYVTPDGRYVVAGSIIGKNVTVIDAATEQVAWVINFDLGVRPITFDWNPDGSTRNMFVQLTEYNGFAVVDFATHKEVRRITHPSLPAGKAEVKVGGNVSHGLAVTPDDKVLIVNSRLNNVVYKYSLPDLKVIGSLEMTGGIDPNWITLTPDGKTAYIAMSGSNYTSAVDIASMKEIAKIPVGQVPKRNATARLQ